MTPSSVLARLGIAEDAKATVRLLHEIMPSIGFAKMPRASLLWYENYRKLSAYRRGKKRIDFWPKSRTLYTQEIGVGRRKTHQTGFINMGNRVSDRKSILEVLTAIMEWGKG